MAEVVSVSFQIHDEATQTLSNITKSLENTKSSLNDFNKNLKKVDSSSVDDVSSSTSELNSKLKNIAGTSLAPLKNSFTSVGKSATTSESSVNRLGSEISQLSTKSSSATKAAASVGSIGTQASKSGSFLSRITSTAIAKVKEWADKASGSIREMGDTSEKSDSKLGTLGKSLISIGSAYAVVAGVKKALDWSDEISQTTSRLNLVNESFNEINGSQQTTKELQDKIFLAAQASRGSYSDLQNLVASLGNNAKDAFANTDEIVKFAQNLNKTFAISGASAEQMSAATLQLTQGLASGTLRGDELNSVLENAPELINVIAESMGVPRGQIRDLAADGQITAEVVKNALLNSSDAINAKFQSMNMTFSQVWTQFTNTMQHAFEPVAQSLGELTMDPKFQESLEVLETTIADLAPTIKDLVSGLVSIAPDVLTWLVDAFKWVVDNGSGLISTITGIGTAFGVFKGISSITTKLTTLTTVFPALAEAFPIIGTAIGALTGPVGWIITAVAGIAAGITVLWNTNEGFRNAVIGIWESIKAAFANAWENISGFFTSFAGSWDEAVASIQNLGSRIGEAFSGIYNSAISWGINLIQGFLDGLLQKWSDITGWFSEKFGWIVDNVKSIFGIASPSTVFSDIGMNLLQGFWDGMKGIWDSVTGWAQGAWEKITSIFSGGQQQEQQAPGIDYSQVIADTQTQLAQLESYVSESLIRISVSVSSEMPVILQTVPQTFAALPAAIEPVLAGLIGIISQQSATLGTAFITSFSGSLLAGGAQIQTVLSQVFNAAIASVFTVLTTQAMQAVSALSTGTIGQISALGTQTISIIGALSLNVAASFAQMTGSSLQTITTFSVTVPALMATVAAEVTASTSALSTNVKNLWNAIKNSVVSIVNDLSSQITSKIDSMASKIVSRLSSLKTEFNTIATDAMTAFKTGIEQSTGGVLTTASNVVQKLKQVFEEGLGVHSPADYMIWIGQMMLEGLILGLSGDKLQKFIESMIGDMQTSFENGNFDANSTVNFLSDQGTLDLIGRVSQMDLGGAKAESIAYPLIGTMGTISSWFGNRPASDTGGIGSTNHGGIDIAASTGTPIAAAIGGTVTTASMSDGYGNLVVIDSGNGLETYYGHMSQILTSAGATVTKGQQIGLVGSTGNSTGPHLHFEMRQNDNKIDPYPYLQGAQVSAGNTLASVLQNAYNLKHGIVTGTQSLGNVAYDVSAGAAQWTDQVLQALSMLGQPASLLGAVLATLDKESSGNPNAINDWDSNWLAGTPSKGLMQVIDPTFATYALPGYNTNIWDPLSNILASLNYQLHRYGNIEARLSGYASGTDYATPGLHWVGENGPELLQFRGGERVYTNSESTRIAQAAADNYDRLNYDEMVEDAVAYSTASAGSGMSTVSNTKNAEITINFNITDYSDIPDLREIIVNTVTQAVEDEAYTVSGVISNI